MQPAQALLGAFKRVLRREREARNVREERKELFFFFSTSGVSRASRSQFKTHLINTLKYGNCARSNIYFYSKLSLSTDSTVDIIYSLSVKLILKESLYHNLSRSSVGKAKIGSSSKEETAPLLYALTKQNHQVIRQGIVSEYF